MSTGRSVRLALGTASALGLGRFAYGLVLPAMVTELRWDLATAGALTTANGLGYLAGALLTAPLAQRLGTTDTFRLGMVLCTLALAATAASPAYPALLTARAAAGVGGALVFIAGAVISPTPVYFAGAGLGIALSGFTLPLLLDAHPDRWPIAWLCVAVAAALATVASWTAARTDVPTRSGRWALGPLWRVAAAYFLFAAGYITYITFLSAYLADRNTSTVHTALTWTLLGIAVLTGPRVWRHPIACWPGTRVLAIMLSVIAGAATLTLLVPTPSVVIAACFAYGATFMAVPAIVTRLIGATVPPALLAGAVALFTVVFAAGQTAGPWLAGILADHTGSAAPLAWTAALCGLAAILTATQTAIVGGATTRLGGGS